jgi:hypothetical protein
MLGYLNRLKKRMVQKGFPPDDELLALVCQAENAMHQLHIGTHYLACGDTAGGVPKESDRRHDSGSPKAMSP